MDGPIPDRFWADEHCWRRDAHWSGDLPADMTRGPEKHRRADGQRVSQPAGVRGQAS